MIFMKNMKKKTTNFEAVNDEDVINKSFLDGKLLKTNAHLSKLEKDYNEFKSQYNKQSLEDILVQRAVNTTIQIFLIKDYLIIMLTLIKF